MPALNPTRQNTIILVGLLLAQLLLMAGSARGSEGSTLLEMGLTRITSPVMSAAAAVGGSVRGAWTNLGDLINARRDNRELRNEVSRLQSEVGVYREQAQENLRLRNLLGMRRDLTPQSVGATVVAANLSARSMIIVVDRGTDDGVHPDLPVVAWGGAVGRVVSAGPNLAKVRLLIDPSSGVSGILQKTRVEGMVLGQGRADELRMLYVPRYSDITLGERVVTSGLDGVFPKGFGIGTIWYADEKSVSMEMVLRPEIDFTRLEEVLILLEPVGAPLLEGSGIGDEP